MILLIVVNSLCMGLATFDFIEDDEELFETFEMIDQIFLIIFTIELVLNFLYTVAASVLESTFFVFAEGRYGWIGKTHVYRFHMTDPIRFSKSLRASIEHGHANHRNDDYCSTAYWYQTEPHKLFRKLPSVAERIPRR